MRSWAVRLYFVGVVFAGSGLFVLFVLTHLVIGWFAFFVGVNFCAVAFNMASPYRRVRRPPRGLKGCHQCGGLNSNISSFCEHCGECLYATSEVLTPTDSPPDHTIEEAVKKWAKKPLVIAGAVLLAIIVLGVISVLEWGR